VAASAWAGLTVSEEGLAVGAGVAASAAGGLATSADELSVDAAAACAAASLWARADRFVAGGGSTAAVLTVAEDVPTVAAGA
jgi:hypothetical protein